MDAWWPKLLEAEFQPGARRRSASPRCTGCSNSARPNPGCEPAAPGLRRRLVRLRQQGPARPARGERRRDRAERAVLAALLRRRLAGSLPRGAAELAAGSAVGHAAADLRPRRMRRRPAGELLRHEPLRQRQRRSRCRRSRSRTGRRSSRSSSSRRAPSVGGGARPPKIERGRSEGTSQRSQREKDAVARRGSAAGIGARLAALARRALARACARRSPISPTSATARQATRRAGSSRRGTRPTNVGGPAGSSRRRRPTPTTKKSRAKSSTIEQNNSQQDELCGVTGMSLSRPARDDAGGDRLLHRRGHAATRPASTSPSAGPTWRSASSTRASNGTTPATCASCARRCCINAGELPAPETT